jgi:hypothetical protein
VSVYVQVFVSKEQAQWASSPPRAIGAVDRESSETSHLVFPPLGGRPESLHFTNLEEAHFTRRSSPQEPSSDTQETSYN